MAEKIISSSASGKKPMGKLLLEFYQQTGICRDDFFAAHGKETALSEDTVRRYPSVGVPGIYAVRNYRMFREAVLGAVKHCIDDASQSSQDFLMKRWTACRDDLLDRLDEEHFNAIKENNRKK